MLTSTGEMEEEEATSVVGMTPQTPKSKRTSSAGVGPPNVPSHASENKPSARLRIITQITGGKLKKKLGGKAKAHSYSISKKDYTSVLSADVVLETFLKHWSSDLKKKEDHLAKLFMSADIDGDGELTASEFTALVHSVDPEVQVTRAVEMYRSALHQSANESIDPEVFVRVCYETGLVHKAWHKHNSLLDVAHGIEELKKTWRQSEPFVMGTLRALERDLQPDHALRTLDEAGDGSLPDLRMQLDNFRRFASGAF